MSPATIRILIAGTLFVHGIGHTLGFWKPAHSLPFVKVSQSVLKLAGGIFWVVIAVGFIAASMGFWGVLMPAGWWRPLAIVYSIISLVALIIFGRSWPLFNFISATAMNIAVLACLLWYHWPPLDMFNR